MKHLLLSISFFCCYTLLAQKEQNNWYFGNRAAISFETGNAVVKYDNPKYVYRSTVSMSDPQTGQLLFYSDGVNVWTRNHLIMANGGGISGTADGDVAAFPVPGSRYKYYLLFTGATGLRYVIIDMDPANGDGLVITPAVDISNNHSGQIVVVKHRYRDAYWVVTHRNGANEFAAFYADSGGVSATPVVSGTGLTSTRYGDMTASHKGNKLAITHYFSNVQHAQVFDFDAVCGIVSNPVLLNKNASWDYPFGVAFSPDDSKLYVAFSYQESQLVQYSGTDYKDYFLVATAPDNFNIIRTGPDGRIYIATHDAGVPGPRIDAVLSPNNMMAGCDYRKTYLNLNDGTGRNSSFELPYFASGQRIASPVEDDLFSFTGACAGDTFRFTFNTTNPYDSLLWKFSDDGSISYTPKTDHYYQRAGNFEVKLTVYRCGKAYEFTDTIPVRSAPVIKFPEDTMACRNTGIFLTAPESERYLWSTGASTRSVSINTSGIVWLRAFNGNCAATDSINLSWYPDIFTSLDSLYFLCEDDSEMVKLDAGEGFQHYKWLPTLDTTQWIIVKSTGDYFVKVTDNFGCLGNDGAKVKRRCGILIYFPNAFTPNGDGLNDGYKASGLDVESFHIRIYNNWGELVYEADHIDKAWDGNIKGKPAADGVYVYHAEYTGVKNKRLQSFYKKGNITLIR